LLQEYKEEYETIHDKLFGPLGSKTLYKGINNKEKIKIMEIIIF